MPGSLYDKAKKALKKKKPAKKKAAKKKGGAQGLMNVNQRKQLRETGDVD